MIRMLFTGILIAGVLYTQPGLVAEGAQLLGMESGGSCAAVEDYFTRIGNSEYESSANKYKFGVDKPARWTQRIDSVSTVECSCSEDMSDEYVQQVSSVPNSVSNLTDIRLATFTVEGVYEGSQATIEGGALLFRTLDNQWYIAREEYYAVNGETRRSPSIKSFFDTCKP